MNKSVRETSHTSETKVGGGGWSKGQREGGIGVLRSWSPPVSHQDWVQRPEGGDPNHSIVCLASMICSLRLKELCEYVKSVCCYWSNELTLKSELKTAPQWLLTVPQTERKLLSGAHQGEPLLTAWNGTTHRFISQTATDRNLAPCAGLLLSGEGVKMQPCRALP